MEGFLLGGKRGAIVGSTWKPGAEDILTRKGSRGYQEDFIGGY